MKLIEDLGPTKYMNSKGNINYKRFGIYECPNCKNPFKVTTISVKNGSSTQCRSCANIAKQTTHGESNTPMYRRWTAMKQRCTNVNHKHYIDYGGRGITVYPEWLDSFEKYSEYVMSLPDAGKNNLTVDRIDNDDNYTPGNLRWATTSVQAHNKRVLRRNTSGVTGVSFDNTKQRWLASIRVDGKRIHLGFHEDKDEAIKARRLAERKYCVDI